MTERPGSQAIPDRDAASQPAPTCEALLERAARLAEFGYRPAEAEFLAAAALLGGYFLRRQYLRYAGCRSGGSDTRFLKLAESTGHAVAIVGKGLFRLRGSSVYKAIRCEDGPRRREGSWAAIKKRLLALDYFLEATPRGPWLLSGADKAAYFASLGIPAERFPASARSRGSSPGFFADGFPIAATGDDPPVVSFSFAQTGSTDQALARHLLLYEPLATSLADRGFECLWVMLADSPVQFPRLRHAWRHWRANVSRDWQEREFFELRLEVEKRNWSSLSRDSVERYACLCGRFSGHATDRRFRKWLYEGSPPRTPGGDLAESCRYREIFLDRDYSLADKVVR